MDNTNGRCKGCGEAVELFARGFCESCYNVRVYKGYTRAELSEAFDRVKNPDNWKLPINVTLPVWLARREKTMIEAAVVFYAGCCPEFTELRDGSGGVIRGTRVTAAGYYAAVGA